MLWVLLVCIVVMLCCRLKGIVCVRCEVLPTKWLDVFTPCRKESLRLLRKMCTYCPEAVLQEVCSPTTAPQQQSPPFATQLTEVVLSSLSTEVQYTLCLSVCLSVHVYVCVYVRMYVCTLFVCWYPLGLH